jgi:hypothetical protein
MAYEITVVPSPWDAVAVNWHWVGRVRRGIWMLYLGVLGLIFGFYLVVCVVLPSPRAHVPGRYGPLQSMGLVFAGTLALGVGLPLLSHAIARRSPAFGLIPYHLDEEGIGARGRNWNSEFGWAVVTTCEVWRGAVLLRSGRLRIVYLPKRALIPEIVAWIEARVRQARMPR